MVHADACCRSDACSTNRGPSMHRVRKTGPRPLCYRPWTSLPGFARWCRQRTFTSRGFMGHYLSFRGAEGDEKSRNDISTQDKPAIRARLPWAWLLKRVFRVDVTVCPKCQGSLKVVELVTKRDAIAKRLAQAALGPMPPPKPLPSVPRTTRIAVRLRLGSDTRSRPNQSPAATHPCVRVY
jgi:hypothetical protein